MHALCRICCPNNSYYSFKEPNKRILLHNRCCLRHTLSILKNFINIKLISLLVTKILQLKQLRTLCLHIFYRISQNTKNIVTVFLIKFTSNTQITFTKKKMHVRLFYMFKYVLTYMRITWIRIFKLHKNVSFK